MRADSGSPLQDDRFLLLGRLGAGGMGSVYRAYDRVHQRLVALKTTDGRMRAGPAHPLSSEFDVWSRVCHPNIVEAYELCVARKGPLPLDSPYLVLEHVPGHYENRRTPPSRLEQVAIQLLHALRHLHETGWVHRDLKPANVLMAEGASLRVKLTDFGLAIRSGAAEAPGVISGSLHYVAPESLVGRCVDERADLYGLGILLYRLATGEMPSRAGSVEAVLRWHLSGSPADPAQVLAGFPERLSGLIRRLTARRVEERPRNAVSALGLLGVGAEASRHAGKPDRSTLARIRLALDAARLGGQRVFSMPPGRDDARAALQEVRVWSQVHGLLFHELDGDEGDEIGTLTGLVLRLVVELGSDACALARRLRLDHALPIGWIDGAPVRDHGRRKPLAANSADLSRRRAMARQLSRFVLYCASRRSLVLHVRGTGSANPLLVRVAGSLARRMQPSANRRRGGLLLLVEGQAGSETASDLPLGAIAQSEVHDPL